jgi:hypothetical protein
MKRKTVFRRQIHCISVCTNPGFDSKPLFYLFALFLLSSLKLFTVGSKGTRGFKALGFSFLAFIELLFISLLPTV